MYVQVADPLVYLSVVGNYTYTILIYVKTRTSKCIMYAALGVDMKKKVKTTYNKRFITYIISILLRYDHVYNILLLWTKPQGELTIYFD